MVNSYAYVGWVDEEGVGQVHSYYIDAKGAAGVHPSTEDLTLVKTAVQGGRLTFEVSRVLRPSKCVALCNVVDPLVPLKVVWAMGTTWTTGNLSHLNMHNLMSESATVIDLVAGTAAVEKLQPVFAVHGFIMFIAWGVLIPSGLLAARYLRQSHADWLQ